MLNRVVFQQVLFILLIGLSLSSMATETEKAVDPDKIIRILLIKDGRFLIYARPIQHSEENYFVKLYTTLLPYIKELQKQKDSNKKNGPPLIRREENPVTLVLLDPEHRENILFTGTRIQIRENVMLLEKKDFDKLNNIVTNRSSLADWSKKSKIEDIPSYRERLKNHYISNQDTPDFEETFIHNIDSPKLVKTQSHTLKNNSNTEVENQTRNINANKKQDVVEPTSRVALEESRTIIESVPPYSIKNEIPVESIIDQPNPTLTISDKTNHVLAKNTPVNNNTVVTILSAIVLYMLACLYLLVKVIKA